MHSTILTRKHLTSPSFLRLSRPTQLAYICALTNADDYARISGDPLWWMANVALGYSETEVKDVLSELMDSRIYEIDGKPPYLAAYEWDGELYFILPYKRLTDRFTYRYNLRAEWPNPDTGDIEDLMTYGDLIKLGMVDGQAAAKDWKSAMQAEEKLKEIEANGTRSADAVRKQCALVVSRSIKYLQKDKDKEQLTTNPHCGRSAQLEAPKQHVLAGVMFDVVEGDYDRIVEKVLSLTKLGVPYASLQRSIKGSPELIAKAIDEVKAMRVSFAKLDQAEKTS